MSKYSISKCDECTLKNNSLVPPKFNSSKVILLCEAPGGDEVKAMAYLVGVAGKELESILKEIGYDLRTDFNILNACCCRPVEGNRNRTPTDDEVRCCQPSLAKNINDIQPDKIIIMGKVPYSALFGDFKIKISEIVGKEFKWGTYPVMVTYHPAAILHAGGSNTEKGRGFRNQIKNDLTKALQGQVILQKQYEMFDLNQFKNGILYGMVKGYHWENGKFKKNKA
jgi:DNA polymerase